MRQAQERAKFLLISFSNVWKRFIDSHEKIENCSSKLWFGGNWANHFQQFHYSPKHEFQIIQEPPASPSGL